MSNDIPDLNQNEINAVKAAQEAKADDDNLIRLSTGVILEAHFANPNMIIKALSQFEAPPVPEVYNKAMGRTMQNPDDPDYKQRMQAWQIQYANAMNTVFILFGTSLKNKPKKMPGPEDDKWLERFHIMKVPVMEDSEDWRYLNWVLSVAAPLDSDTKLIQEKVGRLSGVREVDVQSASTFSGSDQDS